MCLYYVGRRDLRRDPRQDQTVVLSVYHRICTRTHHSAHVAEDIIHFTMIVGMVLTNRGDGLNNRGGEPKQSCEGLTILGTILNNRGHGPNQSWGR